MTTTNRRVLLAELPTDKLGPEHFRLDDAAMPPVADGEVLAWPFWDLRRAAEARFAVEAEQSGLLRQLFVPALATGLPPKDLVVPALVLAAVITITVLVSRWSSDHLGRGGVVGTAALAGLADGHAGAVSAAALVLKGEISTATGVWAAAASIGTNTVVKIGLAFVGGGFRFGRTFAVGMLPAALAFGIVLLLKRKKYRLMQAPRSSPGAIARLATQTQASGSLAGGSGAGSGSSANHLS